MKNNLLSCNLERMAEDSFSIKYIWYNLRNSDAYTRLLH